MTAPAARIEAAYAVQFPDDVRERLRPVMRAVLAYLALRVNDRVTMRQARIAEATEYSVRSVRRALEELERIGLLSREPRHDAKGYRTGDEFTLVLPVDNS